MGGFQNFRGLSEPLISLLLASCPIRKWVGGVDLKGGLHRTHDMITVADGRNPCLVKFSHEFASNCVGVRALAIYAFDHVITYSARRWADVLAAEHELVPVLGHFRKEPFDVGNEA